MSSTKMHRRRQARIGLRQSDDNPLSRKMLFGSTLNNTKRGEVAHKNPAPTSKKPGLVTTAERGHHLSHCRVEQTGTRIRREGEECLILCNHAVLYSDAGAPQTLTNLPDRLPQTLFIFDKRHSQVAFTCTTKSAPWADSNISLFK